MLLDLIATAAAAFAVAGVLLFLVRVLKVPFPKWIVPVAAGGAMLGYAIWSEYSWYPRVAEQLPPTVEVVAKNEHSGWWRPWTYVAPLTSRFIAIDRGSLRTHPAVPDERMVNLLLVARWQGTITVPVLFDCAGARRADLIEGAEFAEDGSVANADWLALPPDDPMLAAVCREA